jgi:6-pyruvoyltetrahydropterin/6-carboxytetrahydropterin synthase
MTHRVSVSKDYLTFSAAHFLTISGHKCERLHGHNYVVSVAVEGPVDRSTGFVVDFAVLKRVLRPEIDALDHRVLVPGANPGVTIHAEADRVSIGYRGGTRFVFPAADVSVVPVSDTTAELLAEMLATKVRSGLELEGITGISRVTVGVEESPGQVGSFTIEGG